MITYKDALEVTRKRYPETWRIYTYSEYDQAHEFGLGRGSEGCSHHISIDKSSGVIRSEDEKYSIEYLLEWFPEYAPKEIEKPIKPPKDMYIRCGEHVGTSILSPVESFDLLRYKTKKKYRRDYLDTPEAYVFFISDEESSLNLPLWLVYKDSLECREILKDVDYGFEADSMVHSLLL